MLCVRRPTSFNQKQKAANNCIAGFIVAVLVVLVSAIVTSGPPYTASAYSYSSVVLNINKNKNCHQLYTVRQNFVPKQYGSYSALIDKRRWNADFPHQPCRGLSYSSSTVLQANNDYTYGRGSEIWPPTNMDRAVQLRDSFPQGEIPPQVFEEIAGMTSSSTFSTQQPRAFLSSSSDWSREDLPNSTPNTASIRATWLDRFPGIVALSLLVWIRPMDIGLVATLSAYTALLTLSASSLRSNSGKCESLPSLPPHGHVPQMIQNPMHDLSYSWEYDIWWRCGVGLGFILPILTIAYFKITSTALSLPASYEGLILSTFARPLFLLCCQALSEIFCRDWLLPLPIRIWIPISYQVVRLVYLGLGFFAFMVMTTTPGTISASFLFCIQALQGLNLVYTLINVFGFLIPVALMRYMRAHFFAVEAASVAIHPGMEETLGFSPDNNDGRASK